MVSGDVNANRLLLYVLDDPGWKGDAPRLARGALGRMQRGRWNTTVANAWGVLALQRFGAAFERELVTGTSAATLGAARAQFVWSEADPVAQTLAWPAARETLM